MEDILKIGRDFVQAMQQLEGLSQVDSVYHENAQSVEAVIPPGRDSRVTKGKVAIKGKREDWARTHTINTIEADGPYIHPPNRFAVRFTADVTQKTTGKRLKLREVAIYSVDDGKISKEEFFMYPR